MIAARPHIRSYPCPKCHVEDKAIRVTLPAARQTAAFFLCDCYGSTGRIRIDGEQELRTPHESIVKAVRDVAAGKAVRLEGQPEPLATLEDLFAACGDLTEPLTLANGSEADTVPTWSAAAGGEETGKGEGGGVGGVGGPSLPPAIATDANSMGKEQVPLVHPAPLAQGSGGQTASNPPARGDERPSANRGENITGCLPARTRPFSVSVVKNTKPGGRLRKVFRYDESTNEVVAETDAYLSEGRVTEITFDSIREFMASRANLEGDAALMMGKPHYPEARIVTQEALARISPEQRQREQIIARDRAHVSWPDGPALVMLDLDHPDQFPADVRALTPTTPEEWRELLTECVPGFADVQTAWAPSSSSYVYLGDRELHGLRGQRFYFVIDSGQEIPRFKEVLHDALVLRGLLWYEVSKSGSLLKRLPFDIAVFQPERLDFAAGPECVPPLEWRPTDPKIWNDGGAYLTSSDLPTTTEEDRRRIQAKLRDARRAKLDEARVRRTKWKEETGRNIALHTKVDPAQAEEVAEAALNRGVLLPEFLLIDSDEVTVSVSKLLDDPANYHGRRFHDPLEPHYRNDSRIAVFLVGEKGELRIYSHAHGGQWWRCKRSVPVVWVGLIDRTVDQISEALERDDCGLYLNGDALVWVNEADARLQTLDTEGLGLRLQRRFKVLGRDRQGHVGRKNLTPRDLKALLSEAPVLPVRRLNAVVRGPFGLADGSIVDTPGYDPASEVFYVADSPYPPRARQQLNLTEAKDALKRLWFPVHLFPLKTDVDRGVLLAAMFSAVIRPSISIAPGYYFTAHSAGTGKTLLAHVIGALQTGYPVAASPLPRDEEERRKHLFASLRHGAQYLLYDNAQRGSQLDSAVLANLVTSPEIEARVLGVSNVERRPNRLTVVLTGNNLILHGDLNRRILPVTLDAGVEHPWQREFPFHPANYVLANWLALRIAALELIQAWRTNGAPPAPGATGFPEWDAIVRSVVVWASKTLDVGVGFADPIEALRAAYTEDPETDLLGNLLRAWVEVFGEREVQLKDVENVVNDADIHGVVPGDSQDQELKSLGPALALSEALEAVLSGSIRGWNGDSRARRLGIYLAQHEGQIAGGLKFVKGGTRGGSRKWRVVRVNEGPATTPDPAPEVAEG
jgi:hypothetical protein